MQPIYKPPICRACLPTAMHRKRESEKTRLLSRCRAGVLRLMLVGGGVLVGSLFPLVALAATTITVTSVADPGTGGCTVAQCTLREAIAAAQAGDTIRFAASGRGTIVLTAGELRVDKTLTIRGPGAARLRIDGNRASRVMHIAEGATVRLDGLTITRGRAATDNGGGLYNLGTVIVTNSTISNNTARIGGGLYNDLGTVTLARSLLRNNVASHQDGGGLYNRVGTVTITRSTLSNNRAAGAGGGLANGSGTVTVTRSTLSGNRAPFFGGGLFTISGTVAVSASTLNENVARFSGGGLASVSSRVTVAASTLSTNSASEGVGGGLFSQGSIVTMTFSTLSANSARDGGGGLYQVLSDNVTRLHNSIIAGNTTPQGGAAEADCDIADGTFRSRGHNLVGANTGCPTDPNLADLPVAPTTVLTQVLGPLQDNGGLTFTHALRPGSPAIDAGDPLRCRGLDQRGIPRPQGARCDIGAFELEGP